LKWLEITVRTVPGGVEQVSDIFVELGTGGVVIEDPAVIYNLALQKGPEEVVLDTGALSEEIPSVKGYLPMGPGLEERLELFYTLLRSLSLQPPPEIHTREMEDCDWANNWKKYYHTLRVGDNLVVKPSWENYVPGSGEVVLEMDPGMAFGCGTHPSTTLCLQLLEEVIRGGETVYDVGTGSGILAVAAARLGASLVLAVDMDSVAVKVARENIDLNGVGSTVRVFEGNLLDAVHEPADVIVANIVANVIIDFTPGAVSLLKPGGLFIASGIYQGRENEVGAALWASGLTVLDSRRDGDWTAFLARL
jgi:ribosomal protein L11 methyltransferase